MTPAGMVALRLAATLVHALPGVTARLGDGRRTLLHVAGPPLADVRTIEPCAFRVAVGRAHEHTKTGARIGFLGLAEGSDPVVDIGVRPGDHALPGGIYRIAVGGTLVDAFVTTLSPCACRMVLTRQGPALIGDHDRKEGVRFLADALTGVTLVHTVPPLVPPALEGPSVLEDLLAGCVADEVLHDLAVNSG